MRILFIALLFSCGCRLVRVAPPPIVEQCWLMADYSCFCIDENFKEGDPRREVTYSTESNHCVSYHMVSPENSARLQEYMTDKLMRLEKCLLNKNNCR